MITHRVSANPDLSNETHDFLQFDLPPPDDAEPVPASSPWGLILFLASLLAVGVVAGSRFVRTRVAGE